MFRRRTPGLVALSPTGGVGRRHRPDCGRVGPTGLRPSTFDGRSWRRSRCSSTTTPTANRRPNEACGPSRRALPTVDSVSLRRAGREGGGRCRAGRGHVRLVGTCPSSMGESSPGWRRATQRRTPPRSADSEPRSRRGGARRAARCTRPARRAWCDSRNAIGACDVRSPRLDLRRRHTNTRALPHDRATHHLTRFVGRYRVETVGRSPPTMPPAT